MEDKIKELTKNEVKFLKENEYCKNEHESYIYISKCGVHHIELSLILNDYKDWLIKNKIVKEL